MVKRLFLFLQVIIFYCFDGHAQLMKVDEYGFYTTKKTETITENIIVSEALPGSIINTANEGFSFQGNKSKSIKLYPPLKKIIITSGYGNRKHPVVGGLKFHNGIDMAAAYEDVFCIADGIVKDAGYDNISGNYIIVEHGNISSSYCHLSRIDKIKGQQVEGGVVLGCSGNTGRSTGPHLHFAIMLRDEKIDPKRFLRLIGL